MKCSLSFGICAASQSDDEEFGGVQDEPVLPRVPFSSCIERWGGTEEMADYFSAALGRRTSALKHSRFATFPPFLMVQLKR